MHLAGDAYIDETGCLASVIVGKFMGRRHTSIHPLRATTLTESAPPPSVCMLINRQHGPVCKSHDLGSSAEKWQISDMDEWILNIMVKKLTDVMSFPWLPGMTLLKVTWSSAPGVVLTKPHLLRPSSAQLTIGALRTIFAPYIFRGSTSHMLT